MARPGVVACGLLLWLARAGSAVLHNCSHASTEELGLEFEWPLDQVENSAGLWDWFYNQSWRSLTSPVGRPGSRDTLDVSLRYVTIRGGSGEKGAILFLVGALSPLASYQEFFWHLMTQGYSPIYAMSPRGQGESDRIIDKQDPGYVEDVGDFVQDLRAFVTAVTEEMASSRSDREKPLFAVCHSGGCAVTLAYAIEEYEAQRPQQFHAIAAITPAIVPLTAPVPMRVAAGAIRLMHAFGMGQEFVPGMKGSFEQDHSISACTQGLSKATNSTTRCLRFKKMCAEYRYKEVGDDKHIGVCNFGGTVAGAKGFFDLYDTWFGPFMEVAGKALSVPILMQSAGDPQGHDGYLMNADQADFCTRGCSQCKFTTYKESKHWIMDEVDALRTPALAEIDGFLQMHRVNLTRQNSLPGHLRRDGESCASNLECVSRKCASHFLINPFNVFGGTCQGPVSASPPKNCKSDATIAVW